MGAGSTGRRRPPRTRHATGSWGSVSRGILSAGLRGGCALGVDELRRLARRAAEILVSAGGRAFAFTGAGVSTESGIPDFRGPSGLWRRIPPEVFTIEYFLEDPGTVWRLYAELHRALASARPNPAHHAIARLEELGVIEAVVTQNIDGLHQAAGSRRVIELHGNAREAVCTACGARVAIEEALAAVEAGELPRCPRCGAVLKPAAVFFGEPLPSRALEEAFSLARRARAVLVAGSSLQVYPAALVPEEAARRGARLVIVNLEETPLDWRAELVVRERVGRFLPLVAEEAEKLLERRRLPGHP